jgi:hypothetical protein
MAANYTEMFSAMRDIYSEQILNESKSKLDPVGKEDEDVDNDGDSDESDQYLKRRRKKISKAISVKEGFLAEPLSFYSWRSNIGEDLQGAIEDKKGDKINPKNVNNYAKNKNGKRVVNINPTVEFKEQVEALGGELVSSFDVEQISEIAADYFVEQGLNVEGVDIVLEELGEEEFCEWVLDLADDAFLTEARAAKKRTGGKSYEQIKAEIETREATKKAKTSGAVKAQKKIARTDAVKTAKANQETKSRPPGQERLIRGAQETLKKATSPETKKAVAKSVANTLSRGVLSAWEGHKSAMEAKKKGEGLGKQLSKGAGAALGSFMKKGTSQFKECIEYLVNEGYDLSEITLQDLYEELETLDEKAVSEQQQKLFGLALSVKRGQTPRSEASDQVLKMVDSMSEKELRKFAKTKHEDVPVRVKEGISYEDLIKYIRKGENQ